MIADKVNMNRETLRLILTEELGLRKNLCQSVAPESHTATVGCSVERSFWHPNALR